MRLDRSLRKSPVKSATGNIGKTMEYRKDQRQERMGNLGSWLRNRGGTRFDDIMK